MPTVQSFGSWKKGAPAADSSSLTENRRKEAEYTEYLNTQSNINTGPLPTAPYGPVAVWRGPVPFGSTALQLGYAGGGPSRKSFSLGKIFSSGNNGLDLAGFARPPSLFTPLSIGGTILWLDAADPNATGTNSVNGATITTWRDKSGLGNNGTASGTLTINSTALNGLPTMNFNGSSYIEGLMTNTGDKMTIFMVMQNPASVNPGGPNVSYTRFLSMGPLGGGSDVETSGFLGEYVGTDIYGFRSSVVVSSANPVNTPYMVEYQSDGTKLYGYLNGTAGDNFPSSGNFNIGSYRIGKTLIESEPLFMTGYISEVLIYRTSLTTSDRQKIEGYLAWKWGLQNQLPANHPYKKGPPVG